MKRVLPAALTVAMMICASPAEAGWFGGLCGKSSCDACCDAGPTCGCEPTCGVAASCGPACGPTCGCEPTCGVPAVVSGCDAGCAPRRGLLSRLFCKKNACDDCCAAPSCGIEPACGCEPTCGIAAPCGPVCGPTCGCEPSCAAPGIVAGCDAGYCKPTCGQKIKGFFGKLFHKHHNHGCDAGCDVGCAAPSCGCEPTCGIEPSCGCGF